VFVLGGDVWRIIPLGQIRPSFNPLGIYSPTLFPFSATLLHLFLRADDNRKDNTDDIGHCTNGIHWKLFIVPHIYIDPIFGFRIWESDPTPSAKVVCRSALRPAV
jgi:hypothetical protein